MKKKILILDFDLTITDYENSKKKFFWKNENNLIRLIEKFHEINDVFKIYIVTRANEEKIQKFINESIFSNLIEKVYGSNDTTRIINLEDISWGCIKLNCINEIMIENNILNKNNIYFIDDKFENRYIVENNGFKNVFSCYGSIVLRNILTNIYYYPNVVIYDLPIYNIETAREALNKLKNNEYILCQFNDYILCYVKVENKIEKHLFYEENHYFTDDGKNFKIKIMSKIPFLYRKTLFDVKAKIFII